MTLIDVFLALLDKYGLQTAVMLVILTVGVRLILWGMRFTDRLYDTSVSRSQSQSAQDENQSKLTLTLANQADDAHKRLARLQDDMVEEQRRNRETMGRLTDQFTGAALLIDKNLQMGQTLVTRTTDLMTRLADIDERMGLYVRTQQQEREGILKMGATLNTILALLTPKDVIS